jgi:hypothetical protein
LFLALTFLSICLFSKEKVEVYKADLTEIYPDLCLNQVREIIHKDGFLYLLEMGNHRIIKVKDNTVTKQIGRIGQKKGEFYYPQDFRITKEANFYVLDFVEKGANRVQIINREGNYISGFRTGTKTWGFAVDSAGNVFLGQPHFGTLLNVYDSKGKRINKFGKLILPSEIYGKKYQSYDKTYKIQMNRVNIDIDNKNDVWVSFLFMPVIIKYNSRGESIFTKILDIPGLSPLKQAIWKPGSKEAKNFLSRNIDGYQMTVIIKDMIYNDALKRIYLLMGNDEILVLNLEGETQYIIKPNFIKGVLENFFIDEQNEIIVRFFFHPELYKLNIKDLKNNTAEVLK